MKGLIRNIIRDSKRVTWLTLGNFLTIMVEVIIFSILFGAFLGIIQLEIREILSYLLGI